MILIVITNRERYFQSLLKVFQAEKVDDSRQTLKFVTWTSPKSGFWTFAVSRPPLGRSGRDAGNGINASATKWCRILCKKNEIVIASGSRDINWPFFVCARTVEIAHDATHVVWLSHAIFTVTRRVKWRAECIRSIKSLNIYIYRTKRWIGMQSFD